MLDLTLDEKVELSRNRIAEAYEKFKGKLYLGHSGGKDSTVIYTLAKEVYPDIPVVHTPKMDTHPLTMRFIYELAVNQRVDFVPKNDMSEYLKKRGFEVQIDGTRASEYTRTDKSNDLVINGVNTSRENMPHFVEDGLFGVSLLYPIVEWTDDEVFEWLRNKGISISKEYGISNNWRVKNEVCSTSSAR